MEFQAVLKYCEGDLIKTLRNKEESAVLLMERPDGQRFVLRVYSRPVVAYQAMTSHDCPFLPQIAGCMEKKGFFVVEEEWIDGVSLQEMLDGGTRLDPSRAALLVSDICMALSKLHQAGFIHRDVKPEHVLMTADGRVVLIDLDASMEVQPEKDTDTRLLGTATYAAPEQFGLSRSDVRTDVYSVGILLNMVLTGAHPAVIKYEGGNLEQVIERCIRMNPQDRYQSAAEVKDALKRAMSDAAKMEPDGKMEPDDEEEPGDEAKPGDEAESDDEAKDPGRMRKPGRGILLKKRSIVLAAALCMTLLVVGIALPTIGFLEGDSPEGGEGRKYKALFFRDDPFTAEQLNDFTPEELNDFCSQKNFSMSETDEAGLQKYAYIGIYQMTEAGDEYIKAEPFCGSAEEFRTQLLIIGEGNETISVPGAGLEIEQVGEGTNQYKFTLDRSASSYLASGESIMGFDITLRDETISLSALMTLAEGADLDGSQYEAAF